MPEATIIEPCEKSKHVIGVTYDACNVELELIDLEDLKSNPYNIEVKFNFCPICGERIIWT